MFICGFPLYKLKLPGSSSLFAALLFTLKVQTLCKDLGKDKRAISFTTCRQTHTQTNTLTHSPYRHSHPSGPRFPVQHLAQTAVCRGEETQSLIRRTRWHSNSATDSQRRSTLIKENYLDDTEEDKLQGNVYLYRLL